MKSQIANRKSQIRSVPEWVMIARVGRWQGHPSGPEVITRAHLLEALGYFERHYRAHGTDLAVDYHHASVLAAQGRLDRAPAAGWIEQMEVRAEGAELWGRVMWTGEAAASIAAGEFRHVSPVLRFGTPDRVTGEPVPMLVHSLALTNTPFLTELEALNEQAAPPAPKSTSAKGGDHMPILQQMAAALNRPEDELKGVFGLESAEDKEVAEALLAMAEHLKELEATEPEPVSGANAAGPTGRVRLNAVCEALGLPSGAGEGALLGAIDALRVADVQHGVARRLELDPLVAAGEESAVPLPGGDRLRLTAFADRREHDEAGQVLCFATQPPQQPRSHRGPAGDDRAGVHEGVRRIVVDRLGHHRADNADFVCDRSDFGKQRADLLAGGAVALEGELRGEAVERLAL